MPESQHLALIGGTGLRLLYDLDRFSEDLDFDHFGAPAHQPAAAFQNIAATLNRRGYRTTFRTKTHRPEQGGTLTVNDFLFTLGLTPHRDETIKIKLEYMTDAIAPTSEVRILNRFGFVAQIQTLSLPVLCARKVHALFGRKRLLPRDLYDLTWFFSRRITPDLATLRQEEIPSYASLQTRFEELYTRIKSKLPEYEKDLHPLLINLSNASRIRLLPQLSAQVLK